jgi:hypothetical protein
MTDEIEGTFDKLKAGAKAVAKKVTDPGKDLGDEYNNEKGKGNSKDYEQTPVSGSSDPMSPEKIASHEPTAVRRDPNQDTGGDPISSGGTNDSKMQDTESGTSSSKSDESTPGVSAVFSCEQCGASFSSRQELKDHTQQQH